MAAINVKSHKLIEKYLSARGILLEETGQRFAISSTRVRQCEARVLYEVEKIAKTLK